VFVVHDEEGTAKESYGRYRAEDPKWIHGHLTEGIPSPFVLLARTRLSMPQKLVLSIIEANSPLFKALPAISNNYLVPKQSLRRAPALRLVESETPVAGYLVRTSRYIDFGDGSQPCPHNSADPLHRGIGKILRL
jgi:hypothetical protein